MALMIQLESFGYKAEETNSCKISIFKPEPLVKKRDTKKVKVFLGPSSSYKKTKS